MSRQQGNTKILPKGFSCEDLNRNGAILWTLCTGAILVFFVAGIALLLRRNGQGRYTVELAGIRTDRETWHMPALRQLPSARLTTAVRIWLAVLRLYLIAASMMVRASCSVRLTPIGASLAGGPGPFVPQKTRVARAVRLSLTHGVRTMAEYSEVLVALDVAKRKHAIAIAECGRTGEIRFLGEIENSAATIEPRDQEAGRPV